MNADRRVRGLYWDAAWKLVEGCSKVSPGCDNCWSEQETVMRSNHPNRKISERADKVLGPCEPSFYGQILLREDNLELPARTKKPTVFALWNDLYHEDVPDDFRDRAYAVMASNYQHTYLILTKRADRMAAYWAGLERDSHVLTGCPYHNRKSFRIGSYSAHCYEKIWHGVTAENQQTADERIPHLLRVPGKRFLSIEPMLGPINLPRVDFHCDLCGGTGILARWPKGKCHYCNGKGHIPAISTDPQFGMPSTPMRFIHAVILGGESGTNARPMHPDWVRSVRDQCAAAGVPFTLKQWGVWAPNCLCGRPKVCKTIKRPEGLPGVMFRCGKKAGRDLDCVIHNNLPWDGGAA